MKVKHGFEFWNFIKMFSENCGSFFEQATNFCRAYGKGKKFGYLFSSEILL